MHNAKPLTLTDILMSMREGGAVEEIQAALKQVTNAVICTGKKGKAVLEIHVSPNGKTGVMVKDSIKVTIPEADKEDTLYYVTEDGGFSRRDPRQPSFESLERVA